MHNFDRRPVSPIWSLLPILVLTASLAFGQGASAADSLMTDSAAMAAMPAPPAPITNLEVSDRPNDNGGEVRLHWTASVDDTRGSNITGYRILKATSPDGPFSEVGDAAPGATSFEGGDTKDGTPYYFKILTIRTVPGAEGAQAQITSASSVTGPVESSAQWIHLGRLNVLVGTALVIFFIMYMINRAKAGGKLYIRKIAGLDAVDEAIGRATEMGKKVFYVPGIQDMDNVQTIAGMIILGYVAEMTATYDTYLEVPVCRSIVLVTAKEVVKEAYSKAGRPDSYRPEQVYYLTDDQFGYAAGIDGKVVRERPATIFYMGAFFAESLILAETGNAAGAIQIAGTAMPSQLPFFVAACDYTLIGEELFAASAYLSKEPRLLGSLKGQDYAKAVILVSIIVGIILETAGIWHFSSLFAIQ